MPDDGACIGEVRMFAGNFAPRNWALCSGQLLAISQYTALFSILGTTYGGDGRTTFGLPDLRGRGPVHAGTGNGLSNRRIGDRAGTETNILTTAQMPAHDHPATTTVITSASANQGTSTSPQDNIPAKSGLGDPDWSAPSDADTQLSDQMHDATTTLSNTGSGQGVNNMPPFTCVNFIICLAGVYPSRS